MPHDDWPLYGHIFMMKWLLTWNFTELQSTAPWHILGKALEQICEHFHLFWGYSLFIHTPLMKGSPKLYLHIYACMWGMIYTIAWHRITFGLDNSATSARLHERCSQTAFGKWCLNKEGNEITVLNKAEKCLCLEYALLEGGTRTMWTNFLLFTHSEQN